MFLTWVPAACGAGHFFPGLREGELPLAPRPWTPVGLAVIAPREDARTPCPPGPEQAAAAGPESEQRAHVPPAAGSAPLRTPGLPGPPPHSDSDLLAASSALNTKGSETHTPPSGYLRLPWETPASTMAHASEHSRGWKLNFLGGGVGRADPQPETRPGPTLGEAQGVSRETCFSTWKTTGSREVGTGSRLPDALDRAALCKKPLPPRPCSGPPSADDLGLGVPFLPFSPSFLENRVIYVLLSPAPSSGSSSRQEGSEANPLTLQARKLSLGG